MLFCRDFRTWLVDKVGGAPIDCAGFGVAASELRSYLGEANGLDGSEDIGYASSIGIRAILDDVFSRD